eukprot:gb/GECG01004821.1/.p1 GENE.gb/GECG01004821.1/~~gb/GECG01004821.1/.p1  ORF type:complete len:701 (+),score=106.73 gb/GECG01004821.1/:1-2103(+)
MPPKKSGGGGGGAYRRQPFSGKKKKEQLKEKRRQKQGHSSESEDEHDVGGASEELSPSPENEFDPRKAGRSSASSTVSELPLHVSLGRSGHVNNLSTMFVKETDEAVRKRKAIATFPIDATARFVGTDAVREVQRIKHEQDSSEWHHFIEARIKEQKKKSGGLAQMPYIHAANYAPHIRKRFMMEEVTTEKADGTAESTGDIENFPLGMPLSQYWFERENCEIFNDAAFEYDPEKEKEIYNQWLEDIYTHYDRTELNQFEHNLEVWKQLWHVLDNSSSIALVADARNPLFHLEPSLYHFVCHVMDKPLYVILNKADLVPQQCIEAWKKYLQTTFPSLGGVVPFTANAAQCNFNDSLGQRRKALSQAHKTFDEDCNEARASSVKQLLRIIGCAEADTRSITQSVRNMTAQTFNTGASRKTQKDLPSRRHKRGGMENEAEAINKMVAEAAGIGSDEEDDEEAIDERETGETNEEPEREKDSSKLLTVGMIGHPNAGKSSIINLLAARKRVSVSRTAGHTKHFQSVPITNGLQVLDCPGLVFPHSIHDFVSEDSATVMTHSLSPQLLSIAMQQCLGVIPLAQVRECYTAIRFLAERIPLERWYGLALPDDWEYLVTVTDQMPQALKSEGERNEVIDERHKTVFLRWSAYSICDAYAAKKGMRIAKTGAPDAHAAGRSILYDAVDGVVSLFFWPPAYSTKHRCT